MAEEQQRKKKCMQFRKSQETEVKVKEEIEAQRVRGRKGELERGEKREDTGGGGGDWVLEGSLLSSDNPQGCIHPSNMLYILVLRPGLKCF